MLKKKINKIKYLSQTIRVSSLRGIRGKKNGFFFENLKGKTYFIIFLQGSC